MRACALSLGSELSNNELDLLSGLLRNRRFPGKHLEIGTAAGGTLVEMLQACKDHRYNGFVVIDPMTYFDNQLKLVNNNLEQHGIDPKTVDIRVTTSDRAYRNALANHEEFDFIFIDGNHRIKYVMQDLRWAKLLRKGGLLCLHDYTPHEKGVWIATNHFTKKNPRYKKIDLQEKLLVLEKNTNSNHEVSGFDMAYAYVLNGIFRLQRSFRKHLLTKN